MTRVTEDELITDLQRVAGLLGHTPTQSEYDSHGNYGTSTIHKHLGGWNAALRIADLEVTKLYNINEDDLLTELRRLADEDLTPTVQTIREEADYGVVTYCRTFDGIWTASVRAGLRPRRFRPLYPEAYRLYCETASDLDPPKAVIALLPAFTGLTTPQLAQFEQSWQAERRDKRIIEVPRDVTETDLTWVFRVPEVWVNPKTEETLPTHLPQLLDWYWDHYDEVHIKRQEITAIVERTAKKAGLSTYRRQTTTRAGLTPEVRPMDLSITHGINLARRGVRAEVITQRLGLKHTPTHYLTLKKIFTWCEHNINNFTHPDWNPDQGRSA